jgi:hypothetical protein
MNSLFLNYEYCENVLSVPPSMPNFSESLCDKIYHFSITHLQEKEILRKESEKKTADIWISLKKVLSPYLSGRKTVQFFSQLT